MRDAYKKVYSSCILKYGVEGKIFNEFLILLYAIILCLEIAKYGWRENKLTENSFLTMPLVYIQPVNICLLCLHFLIIYVVVLI